MGFVVIFLRVLIVMRFSRVVNIRLAWVTFDCVFCYENIQSCWHHAQYNLCSM